jgi:hypothetical protein
MHAVYPLVDGVISFWPVLDLRRNAKRKAKLASGGIDTSGKKKRLACGRGASVPGRTDPQPLHHGPDHHARGTRPWLYRKGHRRRKMLSQSPASRRLTPIKATKETKETTNRTAARVNVGAMTGAATSVGGMMTTVDEFGEF